MKNKGIVMTTWLIVVVAISALMMFLTPQGRGIMSALTSQPTLCIDDPYNWKCICPTNQDKQPMSYGFASYGCVPKVSPGVCNYPIDEIAFSQEWKTETYGCAKEILDTRWPDCPSVECSAPMWIEYSVIDEPRGTPAYAMLECRDPLSSMSGVIRWSVTFSLTDGSPHPVLSQDYVCK